ncbi:MAG TPA: D-Ala-D-Ala carboxypeptidase family metallohydrolase [Bacteroidia bacterium]|nr:D-Ala-D-Ala carboxypeptidase family metallohydrolase [Bacteroidia bacterium]
MTNLSEHFTLDEFTRSEYAERKCLNNSIPNNLMANAKRMAELMEQVRNILGKPIIVNSMYRSPAVNKAVGGASTSMHLKALACDFICPQFGTPYEVAERLQKEGGFTITYDQLIYEGTWVHIGLKEGNKKPRLQALTMRKGAYLNGIVK